MALRVDEAALAGPGRRGPAGVEPVGRGDREQADVAPVLGHQPDRLDRLGRDRAAYRRRRSRRSARAGAASRRRRRSSRASVSSDLAARLLDRPRRQAEIDRAAGLVAEPVPLVRLAVAAALDVGEGKGEHDGELVDEGRLEGGEAVLRHADQRRADRLVRAAFGRERDARRAWRREGKRASW